MDLSNLHEEVEEGKRIKSLKVQRLILAYDAAVKVRRSVVV